jgi:hypothetical protein
MDWALVASEPEEHFFLNIGYIFNCVCVCFFFKYYYDWTYSLNQSQIWRHQTPASRNRGADFGRTLNCPNSGTGCPPAARKRTWNLPTATCRGKHLRTEKCILKTKFRNL